MATVECRDIFNAVYINVRGSYIASLYSSKVKNLVHDGSSYDDENLNQTKNTETQTENNRNCIETVNTHTEITKESVERMKESDVSDKIRSDIDEKFPFALASVCSNLAVLDRAYRTVKGLEDQAAFSEYMLEISDVFPLCERFVFPAIMYVSSMVLIDIDEKRSDDFYDKYVCSVSKITEELPFEQKGTAEKYPY